MESYGTRCLLKLANIDGSFEIVIKSAPRSSFDSKQTETVMFVLFNLQLWKVSSVYYRAKSYPMSL